MPPTAPTRDSRDAHIATVLAGLRFPAQRWQLIAQADYYGADIRTRTELAALPVGEYATLASVLGCLHRVRIMRATIPERVNGRPRSRP